jgi:hypothetical protein
MFVLREAARLLPAAALGVLLLSRRLGDVFANLVQLGTPHAVRRYLPMTHDAGERNHWLGAALLLFSLSAGLFALVLLAGGTRWSTLFFGPEGGKHSHLVPALGFFTVGIASNNLATSTVMAVRRFALANVLQLLNGSGWLLLALWAWRPDAPVSSLLLWQGIGTLCIVTIVFAVALRAGRDDRATPSRGPWKPYLTETLAYGLPRSLSPSLELSFFLIGPWLLRSDPAAAGYMVLALTLLRMANMAVQPVASVGGIAAARMIGAADHARFATGINYLVGLLVYSGVILCAGGYPWLLTGLRLWLGSGQLALTVYEFAVGVFVALVPYALFQGLRPIVESAWKTPKTLYIMLGSLAGLIATYALSLERLGNARAAILAQVVALVLAGGGSLMAVRRELQGPAYFGWGRLAVATVLAFGLNEGLARLTDSWPLAARAGIAALGLATTLAAGFTVLAILWPSPCLAEATQFLLPTLARWQRRPGARGQ